jgi:hypothetical protein
VKKSSLLLLILVPTLAVVVGIVKFVNGPSQGSIRSNPSTVNEVKGASVSLKKLTTSYIEVELPDNLALKTSSETGASGIYAQYMFADTRFASKEQVGLTLAHLNGQNLYEIPFVKQRSTSPGQYVEVVHTSSLVAYRSTANDEYTVIQLHGDDYLTIATTGSSNDFSSIKDITEGAISSIRWR